MSNSTPDKQNAPFGQTVTGADPSVRSSRRVFFWLAAGFVIAVCGYLTLSATLG